MRRYETIFISDPDISESDRKQIFAKTKELIDQRKGLLIKFDEWGLKKLAYDIKKKNRGCYVCMDYCADAFTVHEMERAFRIDDKVMKYMTILLKSNVDIDAVKEEIAQAEAEQENLENTDLPEKTDADVSKDTVKENPDNKED